jgi:hypothetical protein
MQRAVLRRALPVLAVLAAAAASPAAEPGDPVSYEFEVVLAPVCLEGSFPVTVTTADGDVAGTLDVETDVRGALTGTMVLGGKPFDVVGTVRHDAKKGGSIEVVATYGKDRVTLSGKLAGVAYSGTSRGKGSVAPGKGTFLLNVASATSETATIAVRLEPRGRSGLAGTGVVTSCGDRLEVKASGKSGASTKLDVRLGRKFRFSAKGADDGSGLLASWSAKGFGAAARGEGLPILLLAPPSGLAYPLTIVEWETEDPVAPLALSAGSNPSGTFTVEPALPAGLGVDPATGTISGTPTEVRTLRTYTLRAENYAGSATTTVDLATRIPRIESLAPETRPLDDDALRHVLIRTEFAASPEDLAALRAGGLDAWLDAMLALPSGTQAETDARAELVNDTDPPGFEGMFPSGSQLARWWSRLMVENPHGFQETLAFFWHDHFAVSSENFDGSQTHYMVDYVNLFRHRGAGNLRDLLVEMARSPAMLVYLDGRSNTRRAPNENFAREFWELFTLGVDSGYTQADIVEAAKAWSGWRERFDSTTNLNYMQFDTGRHDAGAKTFLGTTIPGQNATDDFEAVVDATLANRDVETFFARKILERWCTPNPPDELVEALAAHLRSSGWDLADTFRTLFRSEAFLCAKAREVLVKEPVEFGVGFMRATGLRIRFSTLDSNLTQLGQRPTQPPTVNGWPVGSMWLSSQGLADRTNLAYAIVEDTGDQGGVAGSELAPAMPPQDQRSAAQVVDHFAARLRVRLSDEDRTELQRYLNTVRQNGNPVASAFDGNNPQHVDERVRGLLLILAQHPTYHAR